MTFDFVQPFDVVANIPRKKGSSKKDAQASGAIHSENLRVCVFGKKTPVGDAGRQPATDVSEWITNTFVFVCVFVNEYFLKFVLMSR